MTWTMTATFPTANCFRQAKIEFNRKPPLKCFKIVVCTGVKDDGGQQSEGDPAAANCGQDDRLRGQGRGWEDLVRRVLLGGRQHGHTQEDGCRRLK